MEGVCLVAAFVYVFRSRWCDVDVLVSVSACHDGPNRAEQQGLETFKRFPDSEVHGANVGPTWVPSTPDGPHVGPMNHAIRFVNSGEWGWWRGTFYVCVLLSLSVIQDNNVVATSHYCYVIMGEVASQITSLTIVYSTVYSDADQRKHQSSASLAFVFPGNRWIFRTNGQ